MSGDPRPPAGEETEQEAPDARRPLIAALLAWALPGLGHLYLGRHGRAIAFFVIVLICFATGVALEGNLYRVMPGQPLSFFATLGSMGLGTPYLLARWAFGYGGDVQGPGYEYGSAFILTAGLMNLLLVLDTLDIARGMKS